MRGDSELTGEWVRGCKQPGRGRAQAEEVGRSGSDQRGRIKGQPSIGRP